MTADDGFCLTSPEARVRAPRPARVTDRDPYRVPGPAVVSVSGGRTSGMMLRGVLDAYGGQLPADVHAIFTNTGEEHPDTLAFVREMSTRWGVDILWLEYDPTAPESYARVDYDTAARDGEPFAALVRAKRYLPNAVTRFCTQELKLAPMRAYMTARYGDDWTNIVGLRFDEPDRVAKLRAREAAWDVACPLYDAGATKADVLAWWRSQPFDLETPEHLGNCMGCFLKNRRARLAGARDVPEAWERWAALESEIGGRFLKRESYAAQLARVRLPVLPFDAMEEEEEAPPLPCDCTQRRMPPVPCVCPEPRRVPREGHTLACAALRAEARRPGPEGLAVRAAHERHHVGGRRRDRAWRLAGRGEWREWMGEMTAEDHAAWARAAEDADAAAPRRGLTGVSL
jgi:3'-phosphoadenosine 5'-phosphosulfate sulfotransferase (PAPS reductase)/FAD synthetase